MKITSSILLGFLSTSMSFLGYAGTMGPVPNLSGKIYAGVFGGGGSSNDTSIKQFGTAFFTEAAGGPLAVNAFGVATRNKMGFVGGQVGYQWTETTLSLFNALSGIAAATELEGYYLGKGKFSGHDLNNNTSRLPEHDFFVTYPVKTGVFLINAVATFNFATQPRFKPYAAAGIGAGVLSINNATAIQIAPPEVGVNHYNSNTKSSDAVFAGQLKAGLAVDLTENFSVFGEYRWIYLSSSNYNFGSTVYPNHAVTSSWLVRLGSQTYNTGALGLRYSI